MVIRVDHVEKIDNTSKLYTSRTTFFNSLLTNRAVDFDHGNGMTNRDLYCYDPFFPELIKSKLSNNLGFNGFVKTADGFLILLKRHKYVSIGKDTVGISVGAEIKAKYALDDNMKCTPEKICNSILESIKDELSLVIPAENIYLKDIIIAMYRDGVEGGKPQLLFFINTEKNKSEVEKKFKEEAKNTLEDIMKKDGKKLIFIHEDKIEDIKIYSNKIELGKIEYKVVPSVAASFVFLIEYMKTKINYNK